MSEIMLLWSEEPGSPIHLEPDEPVLIGGGPACQVRVREAPRIAVEVVVRPGHPRPRAWLPDRPGQARVVLTPYWTDRAGTPRRDDGAASEVEAGSTIEIGGTTFTILKASQIQLGGPLLVQWLKRLVRALFPGTSGGRGSRLKRERALLPGARRRELIRYLGLVVDPGEARLARDTLDLGRLAALFAIPFALVLTAGIWASAGSGDLDPMSASSLLATLGLLITLVTSSFYFAGVGPPVLAIMLSASLLIGVGDPAVAYFIPLLLPLIWYWGGVLDLAWFPVPSEDRFWDAGLLAVGSGLYLLYPVFAWGDLAPRGPGALLLVISAAIIVLWTLVGVPRLHRMVLEGEPREGRRRGFLPRPPRQASHDGLYLAEYVWLNRRRRLSARTLAAVASIVPVLVILNGVDLVGRMDTLDQYPDSSSIVVWPGQGRIVDASLLETTPLVALAEEAWEEMRYEAGPFDSYLSRPADAEGESHIQQYRLGTMDELNAALSGEVPVWAIHPDGSGYADLRRIRVRTTTPAELRREEFQNRLTAPVALMFVFFGALVLWRGHASGTVAFVAALWAIGTGALLALLPSVAWAHLQVPELQPLQEIILSEMSASGPLTLAHGSLFTVSMLTVLLGVAVLSGVLPALVVAEWVLRRVPPEPSHFLKRLLFRLAAPASAGGIFLAGLGLAGLVPGEGDVHAFVALTVMPLGLTLGAVALVHRVGTQLFGASGGRPPHLALLAFPWLFLVIAYAPASAGAFETWSVLATVGLGALAAGLIFWFAAWENTWNLGGGRTGSALALAVLLPVAFALVEMVTQRLLVSWRVVPPAATAFATLLLFGLALRPVFTKLRALAEMLLLWPLRRVLPEIPTLMARLLRCSSDAERRAAIKEVLEGEKIALKDYVFFTRKGFPDERFRPLVQGGEQDGLPPDLELSEELLDDLAGQEGFVDLEVAMEEPRFAVTAPELWRVRRIMSTTCGRPWRYLLPITVGPTVLGLLFVGEQALDRNRRRQRFARSVSDLGVASV